MEVIQLSKRKLDELEKMVLPKNVVSTEAEFYTFNYRGKVKVYKNLYRLTGATFANKLFTLTMLDEYRELLPESFVIPDSMCTVKGNITGFTMPYIKGYTLEEYLHKSKIMPSEKLPYIVEIGKILEQLNHIRNNTTLDSIFINDLHA